MVFPINPKSSMLFASDSHVFKETGWSVQDTFVGYVLSFSKPKPINLF